jgi:hypothetical protein
VHKFQQPFRDFLGRRERRMVRRGQLAIVPVCCALRHFGMPIESRIRKLPATNIRT